MNLQTDISSALIGEFIRITDLDSVEICFVKHRIQTEYNSILHNLFEYQVFYLNSNKSGCLGFWKTQLEMLTEFKTYTHLYLDGHRTVYEII